MEIMSINHLTNQWPAYGGKSLEHDGMLNRFDGHLGAFILPIWKHYDVWLGRLRVQTNRQIRDHHLVANHWSITASTLIRSLR